MTDNITRIFGTELDELSRSISYNYIETFIEENVDSWDNPPDTNAMVDLFYKKIKGLSKEEFAFMLSHTGYIPEFYDHDSSQETLYSKLIEVMVCEWALRIGFSESYIQTQKASKEDITIIKDNKVIVSDAKSFRLGRSQGAPNVKDVIKKADYKKWLESYDAEQRTGGILPFPSLHNWSRGSDVYTYCSDANEPIMFLFYEHLAFMILFDIGADEVVDILEDYSSVHPNPTKNVNEYFDRLIPKLFRNKIDEWNDFTEVFGFIIRERVQNTIRRIAEKLDQTKIEIKEEIDKIENIQDLRRMLVDSNYHNESKQLQKNLVNIRKFRPH